jgi:Uma2 family endonuclease
MIETTDKILDKESARSMSVQTRLLTVSDLDDFPDDGLRREIIAGVLYVSAAPARIHQRLLGYVFRSIIEAVEDTGWGEVYFAPVDVRFSENDQVQPDLLVIKADRLGIYRGSTVFGAPDLVVEILSPSNRSVDLVNKARLYADKGVPEYWILDPINHTAQVFKLSDGQFEPVALDGDLIRSTVIPKLVIDSADLFACLPSR